MTEADETVLDIDYDQAPMCNGAFTDQTCPNEPVWVMIMECCNMSYLFCNQCKKYSEKWFRNAKSVGYNCMNCTAYNPSQRYRAL